jgi:hypothetical protein
MSRSIKKSIAIPQAVRDGLSSQIESGILDYPSENAAWIGLARYQLLIGKPHPVTVAIARMHQQDQDIIDDFLLEIASRRLNLRGCLLSRLIHQAIHGCAQPNEQEVGQLVPQELLKMAREWRKTPEKVMARLAANAQEPG